MADPLTLSVMSQIVRKAGGKDPKPEEAPNYQTDQQLHLTDRQAVLLSELIHKKKHGAPAVKTGPGPQRTEGAMSLDALVKSRKTP